MGKLEEVGVVLCGGLVAIALLLLVIVHLPELLISKLSDRKEKRTGEADIHPCVGCRFYFGEMGITCAVNPGSEGLCREFEATS